MDISDGMDKSWDHPWSTEEMRKKRREWSLAGDTGLLKHLQQFSENLMSRANKTQEVLESLTTQLNETSILIDNVTNKSLSLANTQFIESRVQEDDIEIEKKIDNSVTHEYKDQDLAAANLIANVTESVKQGLRIMDEKYKQMEFVDSDSEEEDNRVVLSVVLGPNNPYQDRPLPYVIGSEKWKNSSKIGLESSSSSESEQVDEEEELESDEEDTTALRDFNVDAASKKNIAGLLPALNESDYSKRNDITYMDNDKLDVASQSNVNSASESITPNDNVPKVSLPNDLTPNFAEELAKRLGTVRQAQKPLIVDEKSESSINRFKDDLFTPEGEEDALTDNSKNMFSDNKGFLNDESLENLWKEKPFKPSKNNIIPSSIDVPPPISTVSTKPKSAIDDLFADADSEDSDDIFSSKNVKPVSRSKSSISSTRTMDAESAEKKYLNIVAPASSNNMITSTPETNVNTSNLFSDDDDDSDLFRHSKNQLPNKKKPVGGISILGNILNSDVEDKLSTRISRTQSSDSSNFNTTTNYDNSGGASNAPVRDIPRNSVSNSNNDQSSIVMARNNAENVSAVNESGHSSGISIQTSSINNTGDLSLSVDFQPQMTSTRLKSEEIYRERIASDSLFADRTRNPVNITSNSPINQQQEEQQENANTSAPQDDVFENEDLFGPPPLPKPSSKQTKSKVSSLFDDSDSGDELFSTASSGSRSQKSTDFLANANQYHDKAKSIHRKGLFDEDIDIFGNKDSPDVDIFGITSKSVAKEDTKIPTTSNDALFATTYRDITPKNSSVDKGQNVTTKKLSLFDDDDVDDGDLFAVKSIKSEVQSESKLFSDTDENDLFAVKKDKKQMSAVHSGEATASGEDNADKNTSAGKIEGGDSYTRPSNGLFSSAVGTRGLIFEDDDYDDLFGSKSVITDKKAENVQSTVETKDDTKSEEVFVNVEGESHDTDIFSKESQEPNTLSAPTSNKVEESIQKDTQRGISEDLNTMESTRNEVKKSPPKTLRISTDVSSSPPEENNQAGRRAVSGKIKNLMGKMGDLKILSPMDTPPLWKRSEEKTDEEDSIADRDSDDGGCISTQGHSSPPSVSEDSATYKQSQQSTVSTESNVESAISFDEPAQIETLSTAASKTRARIQAKRRPQSRHARKSALRQSGIDFDAVDVAESISQEGSRNQLSNAIRKENTGSTHTGAAHSSNSDHLILPTTDNLHRIIDTNSYLAADDKSELSISKESSMSANKNTLLSPSTDEEDLFDVPPDLPEDPQKEDTLFGRAPILSPVDKVLSEKVPPSFKPLRDTHIKRTDNIDGSVEKSILLNKNDKCSALIEPNNDNVARVMDPSTRKNENKSYNNLANDESEDVIDPLRDSSHDPLKDPSQLFAFVTKTPSPEKGKNLLFSEDDSLFSSSSKKISVESNNRKPVLDLFADETDGDLFSATLSKPAKKPLKDTKISLFDDVQDDEDDNLFGSVARKSPVTAETEKKSITQSPRKKISLFDDDDNDFGLFSDQPEQTKSNTDNVLEQSNNNEIFTTTTQPVKTSHITDIFADQSSGEDDIFATKPVPKKVVTSKSLFPSDDEYDDNNQIFGNKTPTSDSKIQATETRSSVKKAVTKDLKRTAEKISKDPLSILQDD